MRNMKYLVCHERGTKKKSGFGRESKQIEFMTFRKTGLRCLYHRATGRPVVMKAIFLTRFNVTRFPHNTKISRIESVRTGNK